MSENEQPTPELVAKGGRNFIERTNHWTVENRRVLFGIIASAYCLQCGAQKHVGASLGIPSCLCDVSTVSECKAVVDAHEAPLRARIAALEAAFLPEGGDIFDLRRAKVEGAIDLNGKHYEYECSKKYDGETLHFFEGFRYGVDDKGVSGTETIDGKRGTTITIQLYCIKRA